MLDYIPKLIMAEDNDRIVGIPNRNEVKNIVFELNRVVPADMMVFLGLFFRERWDIVGNNIIRDCQGSLLTLILC